MLHLLFTVFSVALHLFTVKNAKNEEQRMKTVFVFAVSLLFQLFCFFNGVFMIIHGFSMYP